MAALLVLAALAVVASAEFRLLPLPSFGAEVRGLHVPKLLQQLKGSEAERTEAEKDVERLRSVFHAERILAFRDQGALPWQDQVAFSELFGSVFDESRHRNREPHPAIPDPHVALFSNDPAKGNQGVGVEGWHVDGNVVPVPHSATFVHCISAVPGGDTYFVPLREVVQTLRREGHARGNCEERAPPCFESRPQRSKGKVPLDDVLFQSGHEKNITHPLIYAHPVTGYDTMMFGLGALSGRYLRGCLQPRLHKPVQIPMQDTEVVKETIEAAIEKSGRRLWWRWAAGDLLMVDNRAVAHLAAEGSQGKPEDVGLRLMQRTTVESRVAPRKRPLLHGLPHVCVEEQAPESDASGHYCFFSLAQEVKYPDDSFDSFDSREVARERCRILSPHADLGVPSTPERNQAAGLVVASVERPHWIGGWDEPNGHVAWLDGSQPDAAVWEELPWHKPSSQPNDCDGPESERCMFMGPDARWFDFACRPKQAGVNRYNQTVTPGPVITWREGLRQQYNIYPLCGLLFRDGEAAQLGLRTA